jgi:hypothetical protein
MCCLMCSFQPDYLVHLLFTFCSSMCALMPIDWIFTGISEIKPLELTRNLWLKTYFKNNAWIIPLISSSRWCMFRVETVFEGMLRDTGKRCLVRNLSPYSVICIMSDFFFFWGGMGVWTCKAGALLLEPHLQSILFWLFWRWGSWEFVQAGLELQPPSLILPNS